MLKKSAVVFKWGNPPVGTVMSIILCLALIRLLQGDKGSPGERVSHTVTSMSCRRRNIQSKQIPCIMTLSPYLSPLTGTSRSRQRGGREGREGFPSKHCQSLQMCWHVVFADKPCMYVGPCFAFTNWLFYYQGSPGPPGTQGARGLTGPQGSKGERVSAEWFGVGGG